MNYVTLHQVKEQLKLVNNTTDNNIFNNWIRWSSGLIDWWKGRTFDIQYKQLLLDVPKNVNPAYGDYYLGEYTSVERLFSGDIYLDVSKYDLLAIDELLNGDGTEITASDYILEPIDSNIKNRIRLKRSSNVIWQGDANGNYEQVISLKGLFGYNRNYPNCFVDTLEVIPEGGLSSSSNLLLLSNVSGIAEDLISPRIQVGQMLKIEDEFVSVLSISSDDYGDLLTLKRAYNNTTAVAHDAGKQIYVYRPDDDIVQIALRLVQWRYRQKDQDTFDRTYNLTTQTVTSPTSLPADVRLILGTRKVQI